MHPNWEGELGTTGEAPSFLYAMPLSDGTVFLEETCLVARPTLPFSSLKRRLERRCAAMGIEIEEVSCSACFLLYLCNVIVGSVGYIYIWRLVFLDLEFGSLTYLFNTHQQSK